MRVKRGKLRARKRRKLLKRTKGFKWGRKKLVKRAKEAVMKAETYAYRDRRTKKRDFRRLWNIRINAGARQHDLTYARFIYGLKKANIELDRKVLAWLAAEKPEVFAVVAEKVKAQSDLGQKRNNQISLDDK